jgi:transcriptional regulator of acetoin/glycerol metabolism
MAIREQQAIRRLSKLGERRARLQEEQERLADEIRQTLLDTEGEVSKVDAAKLLGIAYTTLYRVYLPQ